MSARHPFLIHNASSIGHDFRKLALKYSGDPAVHEATGIWEKTNGVARV
jgi:hypothetical protein